MICILAEDRAWVAGAVAAIKDLFPSQTVSVTNCAVPMTDRDNYDAVNEFTQECSGGYATWWRANYPVADEFNGLTAIAGDGSTRDTFADIRDELIKQAAQ